MTMPVSLPCTRVVNISPSYWMVHRFNTSASSCFCGFLKKTPKRMWLCTGISLVW